MMAITENTTKIRPEDFLPALPHGTRAEVAAKLEEIFQAWAPRVLVHIGGHHIALVVNNRSRIVIISSHPDWQ